MCCYLVVFFIFVSIIIYLWDGLIVDLIVEFLNFGNS